MNVDKGPPVGGVDRNRAMSTTYNETRAFLMHSFDITEDVMSLPLVVLTLAAAMEADPRKQQLSLLSVETRPAWQARK